MAGDLFQIQIRHSCEWCNVKEKDPRFQEHQNCAKNYNEDVDLVNGSLWAFRVRQLDLFKEGGWLHPLLPIVEKIAHFIQKLFHIDGEQINFLIVQLNITKDYLEESTTKITKNMFKNLET